MSVVERAGSLGNHRRSMRPEKRWWLLALLCVQCTDTGLYAVGGAGVGGPDKAELIGQACVPLAAGPTFPVKVIYAIEGGNEVDNPTKSEIVMTLESLGSRFTEPYISFDL